MDLKQRKLSKSEWESIEIPVSKDEIEILQLITNGFTNVHLKVNKTDSIFTYLKIEYNSQIEEFLYVKYFADKIKVLIKNNNIDFIKFSADNFSKRTKSLENSNNKIYNVNASNIVRLKSGDQIRLSRLDNDSLIDINKTNIYEFVLFNNLEQMLINKTNKKNIWMFYYYTLNKLIQNNVEKVNRFIKDIILTFIDNFEKMLNFFT